MILKPTASRRANVCELSLLATIALVILPLSVASAWDEPAPQPAAAPAAVAAPSPAPQPAIAGATAAPQKPALPDAVAPAVVPEVIAPAAAPAIPAVPAIAAPAAVPRVQPAGAPPVLPAGAPTPGVAPTQSNAGTVGPVLAETKEITRMARKDADGAPDVEQRLDRLEKMIHELSANVKLMRAKTPSPELAEKLKDKRSPEAARKEDRKRDDARYRAELDKYRSELSKRRTNEAHEFADMIARHPEMLSVRDQPKDRNLKRQLEIVRAKHQELERALREVEAAEARLAKQLQAADDQKDDEDEESRDASPSSRR